MKIISSVIASIILLYAGELWSAETKITFEGQYEYRTDAESLEMLGKQVCFFPSVPSSANVPRPIDDHRLPWFCFTNSKQAAYLLGFALGVRPKECGLWGNAKIVVSRYRRYTGEGDDNDVANLEAVLKKSKPELLSCAE
jgi:hypothetical protein